MASRRVKCKERLRELNFKIGCSERTQEGRARHTAAVLLSGKETRFVFVLLLPEIFGFLLLLLLCAALGVLQNEAAELVNLVNCEFVEDVRRRLRRR